MKPIWVSLRLNTRNGQMNASIPKRKLCKKIRDKLPNMKRAKIYFEDFEEW